MRRLTIDCSETAEAEINELLREIESLYVMTIEIFKENKVMLLSQTFREMMIDKAIKVKEKCEYLSSNGRIYIDAPGIE